MQQQPWMAMAWRELGVREAAGSADNPRVVAYFRDVGHDEIRNDEIAWCAAFVGACLERAGVPSTRALNARSYLDWGMPVAEPALGAIAVLRRTSDPALGHVGFLVGSTDESLILLGGNQGDGVTVSAFDASSLLGFRLPRPTTPAAGSLAPSDDTGFEAALTHVLEMEGGYTDDPHDPGGPTNLGITLAEWARHRKVAVAADTVEGLKGELRSLSRDAARALYLANYWRPSLAPELPPGLSLMHFDASVNHGLGRSSRILQEALAVTVDGEIGPETLGAAREARDPLAVLERYAEIRRRTYRALPHFWRFGRGWLRRVDTTLTRARSRSDQAKPSSPVVKPKETAAMTTETQHPNIPAQTDDTTKWWGQSMTIWGVLLTTVTTVLPTVGPLIGLDISSELARQLGDGVVRVIQSTGGLAGTVMAILGRVRATAPLERRMMQMRV